MIVPFPLASRRSMILRQARYVARLTPESAERHIRQQLKVQGQALHRRGIEENRITQELQNMETAIRATLWNAIVTHGVP